MWRFRKRAQYQKIIEGKRDILRYQNELNARLGSLPVCVGTIIMVTTSKTTKNHCHQRNALLPITRKILPIKRIRCSLKASQYILFLKQEVISLIFPRYFEKWSAFTYRLLIGFGNLNTSNATYHKSICLVDFAYTLTWVFSYNFDYNWLSTWKTL